MLARVNSATRRWFPWKLYFSYEGHRLCAISSEPGLRQYEAAATENVGDVFRPPLEDDIVRRELSVNSELDF